MEKWDDAYRMYRGGLIRRWCENSNENCHDNSSYCASSARTIVGNCTRKALIRPLENNRVHFFKNPINSNVDIFMYIIPDIFLAINKIFFMIFIFRSWWRNFLTIRYEFAQCIFNPSMHLYKVKRFKKETLIEIGVKLEERFLARILASKRLKSAQRRPRGDN